MVLVCPSFVVRDHERHENEPEGCFKQVGSVALAEQHVSEGLLHLR